MKIGLHMMVKGDLDRVGKCLESQLGFADYYAVAVDEREEDDPVYDLCKSIVGDGVYRHQWPNNYSVARNRTLAHLLEQHPDIDFVYWMDSDDICTSDLKSIRQRIDDFRPNSVTGIYQYSSHLSHDRVRLWRVVDGKSSRIWIGAIHDADYQLFNTGGPDVRWEDWVVTHTRVHRDPMSHFTVIDIGEAALAAAPDDLRTMFYLAREYTFVGYYQDALRWMNEYIERSPFTNEKYEALMEAANIYKISQATDKAKELLHKAITLMPRLPFAAVRLADIHREAGEWKDAEHWYRYALGCTDLRGALFDHEFVRTAYAAKWLAVVLHKQGKPTYEWRYWDTLYEETV